MPTRYFSVLLVLMLSLPYSAAAQSLNDMVASLRADYVAAFNAANAARVASFYAEDALYISPSADRVEGRNAIELYIHSAMRQGLSNLTLRPTETRQIGDAVYDLGTYTMTEPGSGGQGTTTSGDYLVLLRRAGNNRLEIVRQISNRRDEPARAGRAPATARDEDEDDEMMAGTGMMQGGRGDHETMHPPGRAAHFAFRFGRAAFRIKCANEESMRACVEATMSLLDKLHAIRPPESRQPPR